MWQLSASDFELAPGIIHLWRAVYPAGVIDEAWCARLLDAEEFAHAARFATPTLRRHYLLAHSLLHTLLSAYTGGARRAYEIARHSTGKPYLRSPQLQPPLEFNMTHAGEMVMIALSRGGAVGVDIELVRPLDDLDALVDTTCTAEEKAQLAMLAPEAQLVAFFRLWTRKEAWLKLLGVGLGQELTTVNVLRDPIGARLFDLPPVTVTGSHEYIGALAIGEGESTPRLASREPEWQSDSLDVRSDR